METSLINTIKENVAELVIIAEVKFIKKFLHAVGVKEMAKDKGLYSQS